MNQLPVVVVLLLLVAGHESSIVIADLTSPCLLRAAAWWRATCGRLVQTGTDDMSEPTPRPRHPHPALWPPWRVRRRHHQDRAAADRALDEPSDTTLEEDLRGVLPSGLVEALPEVAPTVLFTAWSVARHGRSARDLSRMFNLTVEQSQLILAHLWATPDDERPH